MGLFDFLKAPTQDHPRFGPIKFSGGYWRAEIDFLGAPKVALRLRGTRNEVDSRTEENCAELEKRYGALSDEIADVLFNESYKIIREVVDEGEYPGDPEEVPRLASADEVWDSAALIGLEIEGESILLIYGTDWEVEHRLGIYLKDWKVEGLNGSV